jgi:hypothetical protein
MVCISYSRINPFITLSESQTVLVGIQDPRNKIINIKDGYINSHNEEKQVNLVWLESCKCLFRPRIPAGKEMIAGFTVRCILDMPIKCRTRDKLPNVQAQEITMRLYQHVYDHRIPGMTKQPGGSNLLHKKTGEDITCSKSASTEM